MRTLSETILGGDLFRRDSVLPGLIHCLQLLSVSEMRLDTQNSSVTQKIQQMKFLFHTYVYLAFDVAIQHALFVSYFSFI